VAELAVAVHFAELQIDWNAGNRHRLSNTKFPRDSNTTQTFELSSKIHIDHQPAKLVKVSWENEVLNTEHIDIMCLRNRNENLNKA
jgi:hypothetical protein